VGLTAKLRGFPSRDIKCIYASITAISHAIDLRPAYYSYGGKLPNNYQWTDRPLHLWGEVHPNFEPV